MISQQNNENENFKKSTFLQILFYISKSKIFIDNSNNNSNSDNKLETSQLLV